ncbi:MAG: hypothetical protein LPL29_06655 [Alphaproteobacteria bacterium]|nr:hypothetical protein [Alphaproteobacteria bacterium]MDX5369042.1 hypothetical protein [Alphaproteobacteria bacterium]
MAGERTRPDATYARTAVSGPWTAGTAAVRGAQRWSTRAALLSLLGLALVSWVAIVATVALVVS